MTGTTSTKRGKRKKAPAADEYIAPSQYSLQEAAKHADVLSWVSIIIFGFGNFVRKQYVKGLVFILCEAGVLAFLATTGAEYLPKFGTLGTKKQGRVKINGFWHYVAGDNSVEILLYGVMSIAAIVVLIYLATLSLRSAYKAQAFVARGEKPITFVKDVESLLDRHAHVGFMTLPTAGIVLFTVLPLVFMISMAFTNYDRDHTLLFHWVGLNNFFKILGNTTGTINAGIFFDVLIWTLVWAFFATFLNFFFGMFMAMIINRRTTRLKSLWRICFSLTIAVPQFVSLLVMHSMLQRDGAINRLLISSGWIHSPLPFFQDATWARVTVILINLWVGIPYTIMQITGILQNVPAELYEAAELDGASWWQRFMNVIGDVKGKKCILFDDMVDTAGSLCNAAKAIVEIGGATEVYACATHGVLSGPANERIADSCIKELTFLNTIPPLEGACSKIKYLDVSPIFADAIQRIYEENSMSVLF